MYINSRNCCIDFSQICLNDKDQDVLVVGCDVCVIYVRDACVIDVVVVMLLLMVLHAGRLRWRGGWVQVEFTTQAV